MSQENAQAAVLRHLQEAQLAIRESDQDQAGKSIREAARACANVPDTSVRTRLLADTGLLLVQLKDFEGAQASFTGARNLAVEAGDRAAEAEQWGNLGSTFRDREQYETALEHYNRALSIFHELDHQHGRADQHANIGYIYAMQGKTDDAVREFRECNTLYSDAGDDEKAALAQQNIQALLKQSQV